MKMLSILGVSFILFVIGVAGFSVMRKNMIVLFLCVELMLLSVNLNFVIFGSYLDDPTGQVMAIFVLTVAAAEAGIGLALLVIYYRISGGLILMSVPKLKG